MVDVVLLAELVVKEIDDSVDEIGTTLLLLLLFAVSVGRGLTLAVIASATEERVLFTADANGSAETAEDVASEGIVTFEAIVAFETGKPPLVTFVGAPPAQ